VPRFVCKIAPHSSGSTTGSCAPCWTGGAPRRARSTSPLGDDGHSGGHGPLAWPIVCRSGDVGGWHPRDVALGSPWEVCASGSQRPRCLASAHGPTCTWLWHYSVSTSICWCGQWHVQWQNFPRLSAAATAPLVVRVYFRGPAMRQAGPVRAAATKPWPTADWRTTGLLCFHRPVHAF
jgi:hypothetical protein